jgi:hypothetical protein
MRRLAAGGAEIPVRHPLTAHTERGVAAAGAVLGHGATSNELLICAKLGVGSHGAGVLSTRATRGQYLPGRLRRASRASKAAGETMYLMRLDGDTKKPLKMGVKPPPN